MIYVRLKRDARREKQDRKRDRERKTNFPFVFADSTPPYCS
jgi:hypothetical protein